ncbi:hypothetical protein TorRG33x02_347660 [Trema orientale]|uniref:Uncharacterized protein n=1 Tax=Trema orientale TaxID=63057 RepID=A0A2P5ALA9_TREOI|nr:hypothetical protein TorRG33x02_347660 [Trema orientale]
MLEPTAVELHKLRVVDILIAEGVNVIVQAWEISPLVSLRACSIDLVPALLASSPLLWMELPLLFSMVKDENQISNILVACGHHSLDEGGEVHNLIPYSVVLCREQLLMRAVEKISNKGTPSITKVLVCVEPTSAMHL